MEAFTFRFSDPPPLVSPPSSSPPLSSPPLSSPPSSFDNRLSLHSLQGHVTIDLLDNFPKLLKAFSGCGEQFYEIALTENEGVRRER
jgi:hypothetical protein